MPGFPKLREELAALLRFMAVPDISHHLGRLRQQARMQNSNTALPDIANSSIRTGHPAHFFAGTPNAIDLNSGRYLWKIPLG